MAELQTLVGRIVESVNIGGHNEEIYITCKDGSEFRFYHEQDCCESVYIESIEGDLQSLVGNTILLAEERSNTKEFNEEDYESSTWTFYTLASIAGHIDIRWLGTSNGYYSERVDFEQVK